MKFSHAVVVRFVISVAILFMKSARVACVARRDDMNRPAATEAPVKSGSGNKQ